MRKLLVFITVLSFVSFVWGQEIPGHHTDSLQKTLQKGVLSNAERLKTLIALAYLNVLNEGESKENLHYAAALVKEAERLNVGSGTKQTGANILLLQALIQQRLKQESKANFIQAIAALKSAGDQYHLALAELEFSKLYDGRHPIQLPVKVRLQEDALKLWRHSGTPIQKTYALKAVQKEYAACDYYTNKGKISYLRLALPLARQVADTITSGYFLWEIKQKTHIQTELKKIQTLIKK